MSGDTGSLALCIQGYSVVSTPQCTDSCLDTQCQLYWLTKRIVKVSLFSYKSSFCATMFMDNNLCFLRGPAVRWHSTGKCTRFFQCSRLCYVSHALLLLWLCTYHQGLPPSFCPPSLPPSHLSLPLSHFSLLAPLQLLCLSHTLQYFNF